MGAFGGRTSLNDLVSIVGRRFVVVVVVVFFFFDFIAAYIQLTYRPTLA